MRYSLFETGLLVALYAHCIFMQIKKAVELVKVNTILYGRF